MDLDTMTLVSMGVFWLATIFNIVSALGFLRADRRLRFVLRDALRVELTLREELGKLKNSGDGTVLPK